MARRVRREIWCNGHYLETVKNQEIAEAKVRTYERMDRNAVEHDGYPVPLNGYPVYEIK